MTHFNKKMTFYQDERATVECISLCYCKILNKMELCGQQCSIFMRKNKHKKNIFATSLRLPTTEMKINICNGLRKQR